jgi:hypothetical protein
MFVQCLISIPGRPSTFQQTWACNGKPIDADQVRDITHWLLARVHTSLALSVGIQEVLDETS